MHKPTPPARVSVHFTSGFWDVDQQRHGGGKVAGPDIAISEIFEDALVIEAGLIGRFEVIDSGWKVVKARGDQSQAIVGGRMVGSKFQRLIEPALRTSHPINIRVLIPPARRKADELVAGETYVADIGVPVG